MKAILSIIVCMITASASAIIIKVPADHPTIQGAIDAAVDGDIILVEPGVYSGENNFNGKSIIVASSYGPETCIIDGNNQQPYGFRFDSGETGASLLAGFTIANCYSTVSHGTGALQISNSSPRIFNCVIRDNMGINNVHSNNTSPVGGIHLINSTAVLMNCLIENNSGYCNIMWNYAIVTGGIICSSSSPVITNCTIADNSCSNFESGRAAGFLCRDNSSPVIRNTIIQQNQSTNFVLYNSTPDVQYSNIRSYSGGTANIDADPLFVTGPHGDYYLESIAAGQPANSPSLNTGNAAAADTCFDTTEEIVCMSMFTVQTNEELDAGTVDMGYHYGKTASGVGTRIDMSTTWLIPGDDLTVNACIYNTLSPLTQIPLFVILDAGGMLFFWDSWSTTPDYRIVDVPKGITIVPIIEGLTWPDTGTSSMSNLVFWSAMTDSAMSTILGGMDGLCRCQFGYGPN